MAAARPARRVLRGPTILAGILFLAAIGALAAARFRPYHAYVPGPPSGLETWTAVAEGLHNSNTDLIRWRGSFWLAHAAAPWHFRSAKTRIVLRRSPDARA